MCAWGRKRLRCSLMIETFLTQLWWLSTWNHFKNLKAIFFQQLKSFLLKSQFQLMSNCERVQFNYEAKLNWLLESFIRPFRQPSAEIVLISIPLVITKKNCVEWKERVKEKLRKLLFAWRTFGRLSFLGLHRNIQQQSGQLMLHSLFLFQPRLQFPSII